MPVGISLSGGIDSAAIAAFTAKYYRIPMHAFSVGYPGRPENDERGMARKLAQELGLLYHDIELKTEDLLDSFPSLVYFMDDPIADIAAFMTAFYMFRAVFMTFFGKSRMDPEVEHHAHESPSVMTYPLMALAVLSTVGGLVGIPIMKGWNKFHEFLAPVIGGHGGEHAAEQSTSGLAFASEVATHGAGGAHKYSVGFEIFMMEVSVAIGLAGIIAAWYFYMKRPDLPEKIAERFKGFYHLLVNKYFVDEIYHAWVVTPINIISNTLWKGFDEKLLDGGMVNGSAWLVQRTSGIIRRLQSGSVQHYALSILVGLVLILYLIMK